MSDNEAEEEAQETNTNLNRIDTKRIFINHIDTFNGKNISKVNFKKKYFNLKSN